MNYSFRDTSKMISVMWPFNRNKYLENNRLILCHSKKFFPQKNQKIPIRKGFPGCNKVPGPQPVPRAPFSWSPHQASKITPDARKDELSPWSGPSTGSLKCLNRGRVTFRSGVLSYRPESQIFCLARMVFENWEISHKKFKLSNFS